MVDPARSPRESLPPTEAPLVSVRDLSVHFRITARGPKTAQRELPVLARVLLRSVAPAKKHAVVAVDDLAFHIARGEVLGLVGESGCGKSTTGRALLGLERPVRGSKVSIDGVDVVKLRRRDRKTARSNTQMIFQDPFASLNPRMTLVELVREPLQNAGEPRTKAAQLERAVELLERVGLSKRDAQRYPHELSGGQRQRVAIARALAPEPKFLVADEPVSALDVSIQAQIINLLVELQRELNLSMLFIAHDLAVVRHISQRIAVMYLGRLVEVGQSDALIEKPLHPYTRALISAVPIPDPSVERTRRRLLLDGDVPSPLEPPSGCAFHPRCPDAVDRCRSTRPLLKIGKLERPVACHVAHDEV